MSLYDTIVRVASLVACGSSGCGAMVQSMSEYQGPLTPCLEAFYSDCGLVSSPPLCVKLMDEV